MKIYYSNRIKSFDATGIVNDGSIWIVCRGSRINPKVAASVSNRTEMLRKKTGLIIDNILQEDVYFKSASKAAQFVSGFSVNGMKAWRTKEGEKISVYVHGKPRKPVK